MRRLAAAVAAVVACGLGLVACGGDPAAAATRVARERRDQAEAEGPISGLGAASATAEGSGSADDADAMPS